MTAKWPADEMRSDGAHYEALTWQEALEELEDAADEYFTGNQCAFLANKVRSRIAELEAQVPKWRLPSDEPTFNEDTFILVTRVVAGVRVVEPAIYATGVANEFFPCQTVGGQIDWARPLTDVVGWMPMPMPVRPA